MTSTKLILQKACILVLAISTLSGCATALVAGVAITTVDIIHDRRSIGEYIDDGGIEFAAKNVANSNKKYRKGVHLKTQSWNGILLLTGEIESIELKRELLPKLSQIRGVRQIVDETTINSKSRFNNIANDAWISSKVKSRLILKTGLDANRVKVVTTQGSVYLMGIVTHEEADKATEHASSIRGVKRVVRVFEYKAKSEQ
ncbi:MAG: BON domain-containing protein [Gammaproteobacteria bacterium]|nr:BON domain-containing protein [Gammaproteobacteria bacterium]